MSFFRATDTGTILLGPGDIYTLLAAAAETGGDYIALEALVYLKVARPFTYTTIRSRPFISSKERWK